MAVSFNWNHHGLLDRWQIRMHESPWVFNQFTQADLPAKYKVRNTKARDEVYSQTQREDIAAALHNSFEQVTDILGYYPQPTYTEKEVIRFSRSDVRSGDPLFWRGAFDDPARYRIQKRKLIRFGNKVFTEVPQSAGRSTNYAMTSKKLVDGVPGYQVNVYLNEYTQPNRPSLKDIMEQYYFSLRNLGYSTLQDKKSFNLRTHYPRIVPVGGGSLTYDYVVNILAWELVNLNHRYNELFSFSSEALKYSDDGENFREDFDEYGTDLNDDDIDDWDEDGPVVDDSQIVVSKITYESTGAVNLLTHPEVTGTANVIRTPVEAYIIDAEEGSFGAAGQLYPNSTTLCCRGISHIRTRK